ncbi:MAG: hypothetical protein WDO13_04425 [Verrucomicrobiota bacterium]
MLLLVGLALPMRAANLSPLAPTPDWSALDAYQRTITREEFTRLINQVYSIDGAFWAYCDINDERAIIYGDLGKARPLFTLRFAASESSAAPLPYAYKTRAVSTDPARPLKGIKIALDPGHIGGDWAQLEARYFKLGDDPPVEEAKLNLITCERLAERLQADGATIIWAKRGLEPVTDLRPDDLRHAAIAALALRNPPNNAGYTPSFLFGLQLPHPPARHPSVPESRIDNEPRCCFTAWRKSAPR